VRKTLLHHVGYRLCRYINHQNEPATCSRCHEARATWLQKGGRFQRYFCDECVQVTAAWKNGHANKKRITEVSGD